MEKKTMGSFLSALRRAQGMTQQEVADRLLVSNRAVSRWERDETVPDITLLPAIADLFGVTVDELLRGERRRTVELPPTDAAPGSETGAKFRSTPASAADAAGESPAMPRPASPDPRALRGGRALCRREVARFETFLILAVALVVAGYVCLLGVTYGLERVYVGFAVFLLFCVGSVVLSLIAMLRLRDSLVELGNAMGDGSLCLTPEEWKRLLTVYVRGCFAAITAPVAGVVLSLPLVLYKKHSYIDQCFYMDGEDYFVVALILGVGLVVAGLLVYPYYRDRLLDKWGTDTDMSGFGKAPRPHVAALRRLNLRQWLAAAIGFVGGFLLECTVMACVTPATSNGWPRMVGELLATLVSLAGLAVPIGFLIANCRRTPRTDRTTRCHLLISGVRNVAVVLLANLFWWSGLYFVSGDNNSGFYPSFEWNSSGIAAWLTVTVLLFGIAEIVRQIAVKRAESPKKP